MSTWMLAWRNLLRNRRRSIATLMALAIGAAATLLFGGFSSNIKYTMLTGYVRSGGHLQIQHRDYFVYGSGNPTAYGIADYVKLVDGIAADPVLKSLVAVVTPVLQFGGIAANYEAGVSRTVLGTGYLPADINRMRSWNEYAVGMDSPRFALEGAAADAAVVGVGVARVLLLCEPLGIKNCPAPEAATPKADVGSLPSDIAALAGDVAGIGTNSVANPAANSKAQHPRIELLVGQSRGAPNVTALQVLAAEDQGFKELDEVLMIISLQQAQALVYGRGPARVTAIILQLHNTAEVANATRRVNAVMARVSPGHHLSVLDFKALNPFFVQTIDLFDMIFGFIFVLIGGIVLFTVGNTMAAAVVERTVEIGTLRAIGLRQVGIRKLFIAEGFLLGCAGASAGAVLAIAVGAVVNAMGLTWQPPGGSELLPLTLRIWGEGTMLLSTTIGLIAIGAVSAWWPAWRAARLKIVDALRHA